jgi:hypothetical protein
MKVDMVQIVLNWTVLVMVLAQIKGSVMTQLEPAFVMMDLKETLAKINHVLVEKHLVMEMGSVM